MKIKICHLYPDLLNLYGDRGNILSLSKRCAWRDIEVEVVNISIGDKFDSDLFDIIFLGGGQDYEQEILSHDILVEKSSEIKNAIKHNKTFLCICGGYQILGEYYINQEGQKIKYLNAIDIYTESSKKRMIGNTIYKTSLFDDDIVGFENHSGKTYIFGDVLPLAKVIKGYGNNGEDGKEGAIFKNVICSYSHGPLLPKNPKLADNIIERALSAKYGKSIELDIIEDSLENLARIKMKKMII